MFVTLTFNFAKSWKWIKLVLVLFNLFLRPMKSFRLFYKQAVVYLREILLKTNGSENPFSLRRLSVHSPSLTLSSLLSSTVNSRSGGSPVSVHFTSLFEFSSNGNELRKQLSSLVVWALTLKIHFSCSVSLMTFGCLSTNWGRPARARSIRKHQSVVCTSLRITQLLKSLYLNGMCKSL